MDAADEIAPAAEPATTSELMVGAVLWGAPLAHGAPHASDFDYFVVTRVPTRLSLLPEPQTTRTPFWIRSSSLSIGTPCSPAMQVSSIGTTQSLHSRLRCVPANLARGGSTKLSASASEERAWAAAT